MRLITPWWTLHDWNVDYNVNKACGELCSLFPLDHSAPFCPPPATTVSWAFSVLTTAPRCEEVAFCQRRKHIQNPCMLDARFHNESFECKQNVNMTFMICSAGCKFQGGYISKILIPKKFRFLQLYLASLTCQAPCQNPITNGAPFQRVEVLVEISGNTEKLGVW